RFPSQGRHRPPLSRAQRSAHLDAGGEPEGGPGARPAGSLRREAVTLGFFSPDFPPEREMRIAVTFYVENRHDRANSAYVMLPAATADYLLSALAYRLRDLDNPHWLLPTNLLDRIRSMRRQFALGRMREFTSAHVGEPQLLSSLQE